MSFTVSWSPTLYPTTTSLTIPTLWNFQLILYSHNFLWEESQTLLNKTQIQMKVPEMDFTDYAYTKDLDIAKVQHIKKAPNREAMAPLHAWSTVSQDILKRPKCIEGKDTLSMRGNGWQYSLLQSLRPAIGLYLNCTNRWLKCSTRSSSSLSQAQASSEAQATETNKAVISTEYDG